MPRPAVVCLLLAVLGVPGVPLAADGGAIHGTILTVDGRTLTGVLRWDRNENYWDDHLDATKEEAVVVQEEEGNSFRFLGLRLPSWGHNESSYLHQFSIPFGHLQSIQRQGDDRATINIKGGSSFSVRANGDLGRHMRGIQVLVDGPEPVELEWQEIDRVEFSPSPTAGPGPVPDAPSSQRLYGSVSTRRGSFTGFVVWDRDEALLTDTIDGENDDRKHEIPLAEIRFIARDGYRGSRLGLTDGTEITLTGTNDVNENNRDIIVTVPTLGVVAVEWDEFIRLDLAPAPPSPTYASFDGGYRLHGRVTAADGTVHQGAVTWDLDEQYSWETLDGKAGDVDYAIPFAGIASIENSGRRGAVLHLRDGTVLELEDSNDVDDDNKGIVVESADGQRVELDWDSFQALELQPPAAGQAPSPPAAPGS